MYTSAHPVHAQYTPSMHTVHPSTNPVTLPVQVHPQYNQYNPNTTPIHAQYTPRTHPVHPQYMPSTHQYTPGHAPHTLRPRHLLWTWLASPGGPAAVPGSVTASACLQDVPPVQTSGRSANCAPRLAPRSSLRISGTASLGLIFVSCWSPPTSVTRAGTSVFLVRVFLPRPYGKARGHRDKPVRKP